MPTGVSAMLGGALGQLFIDLDKIPEWDRSNYERALHTELLELANRLRPLATNQIFDGATLRMAIEHKPETRVSIDLHSTDSTRVRCNEPRCPNKRL